MDEEELMIIFQGSSYSWRKEEEDSHFMSPNIPYGNSSYHQLLLPPVVVDQQQAITAASHRYHQHPADHLIRLGADDDGDVDATVPSNNPFSSSSVLETDMRGWRAVPKPISRGPSCHNSLKDRLLQALGCMQTFIRQDQEILVQIWMPTVLAGGHQNVLTTLGHPYLISPCSGTRSLAGFRNVSEAFRFVIAEEELVGFPGRTFLDKLPEWTPDVGLFTREEYPLREYAKQYRVNGSLAMPILTSDNSTCLGVLEIAMTNSPKISSRRNLQQLCRSLEAVDLNSSQDFCAPGPEYSFDGLYQVAVPEISEILQSVCVAYRLPLALTWAPCPRQGRRGFSQFPDKFGACIAVVDSACFVADGDYSGFAVAASEQYFFRGQGIVGRAFQTERQCFSADASALSKTAYPLSHHAKIFNLQAALAVPLRSIYNGSVEFVVELFLPKGCRDAQAQWQMCQSLSVSLQEAFQSLLVVTEKELEQESESRPLTGLSSSKEEPSWISRLVVDAPKKGGCSLECCPKEEPQQAFRLTTYREDSTEDKDSEQVLNESELNREVGSRGHHLQGRRKSSGRRRSIVAKTISLQVLRQHFAGSLKDAAKSIGVCPTTLKRICREQGIARWPSRKINKVGRSLKKLQSVMDSVQGTQGTIQIGSAFSPDLPGPDNNSSSRTRSSNCLSSCCSTKATGRFQQEESLVLKQAWNGSGGGSSSGEGGGGGLRVKARFGEENVRMRLRPGWSLREFQQELARRFRFRLEDPTDDHPIPILRYVDEHGRWVPLASDADLDHCKDIYTLPHNNTLIKIDISTSSSLSSSSSSIGCSLCDQ